MKKQRILSAFVIIAILITTLYLPGFALQSQAAEATTEFPWQTTKIMTNGAFARCIELSNRVCKCYVWPHSR